MTPDFAKAIDPIIEKVVDLKERIQHRNVVAPESIQNAFRDLFTLAESALRNRQEEWEFARYALMVWIDEELSAPQSWQGWQYWTEHKLQVEFDSRRRGEQVEGREEFFRRAKDAGRLPRKDALEVYFLCVVLGFQGVYDGAPDMRSPTDLRIGLPATREDWLRSVREWIQIGQPPFNPGRPNDHDHPNNLLIWRDRWVRSLLWMIVATALLAGTAFTYFQIEKNKEPPAPSTQQNTSETGK